MLRRRAQSDERRRRVLNDDSSSDFNSGRRKSTGRKTAGSGSQYCQDALSNQIRISDLVPRRAWLHPLLFLLGAGIVSGLIALQHWQLLHGRAELVMFNMAAAGSLASWISSIWLAMIAAVSMILYSLRRQRESDYHTRYRVWLWIALSSLLVSAAATTSWHSIAAVALATSTAGKIPGGVVMLWLIPSAVGLAILAVRLLLEVRGCRLAAIAVIATTLAYATAFFSALSIELPLPEATVAIVLQGCQLGGHLVLLSGLLWYARYVVLDIQGLVAHRVKGQSSGNRKKSAKATKSAETADRSSRIDEPHSGSPSPAGRSDLEADMPATKRAARLAADTDPDEDLYQDEPRRGKNKRKSRSRRPQAETDDSDYDEPRPERQRKLSKAERKRLRKLKARQRDAA